MLIISLYSLDDLAMRVGCSHSTGSDRTHPLPSRCRYDGALPLRDSSLLHTQSSLITALASLHLTNFAPALTARQQGATCPLRHITARCQQLSSHLLQRLKG
eukprot:1180045-Prorocentrum_minimum.AAC.5